MHKAKYKPWHARLNQKWILINTATKQDTSQGFLSYVKKAGEDNIHVFCFYYV